MTQNDGNFSAEPEILWSPPSHARQSSRVGRYLGWLEESRGLAFAGYDDLWRWSVSDLPGFWSSIWDHLGVRAATPPTEVLVGQAMPGTRWFPGATLNYAGHLLEGAAAAGPGPVVVARSQSRPPVEWSAADLAGAVARARAGLVRLGVGRGDRVAAYLPNIPEAVALFLAAASLGAVFSSCAPEFGARSVLDRFSQITPKVLVAVDGYRYGARSVDRRAEVAAIAGGLPGLAATVVLPYLHEDPTGAGGSSGRFISWGEFSAEEAPLAFDPVPFDHPLYVLFSSGTTGLPKAIVHGHGGITLEHGKALALHHDLGPGDRFFWFSTTGWMMWNLLVSGLSVGAAIVLFDGDPAAPDLAALWRLAEEAGVTSFGVSAPFLLNCRKAGLVPREVVDLSRLRAVGSTGAPLPAEGFRWVYEAVASDVLLASASGGTDVCTAFLGMSPLKEVRAGEFSCPYLGAKVEAYDQSGRPVVGVEGELVITAPMPSMPVGLWGDDDGSRLREAYFNHFPGVWRHGDWVTFNERGGAVISGRSDATLNRGGVRIGTAEFYSVVEALVEVADSLVVHLEGPEGGAGTLLLFVALAPGAALDSALAARIRSELRTALSPRHVPDAIHAVPAVPRTLSGKKLEVPVKRILGGADPEVVASRGSLADPSALDAFVALAGQPVDVWRSHL